MRLRTLFCLLPLFLCLSIQAQEEKEKKHLYKWRDANGNLVISDKPQPGAVEIPIKEVPVINLKETRLLDKRESAEDLFENPEARNQADWQTVYQTLDFASPEQDGVIRNNGAMIILEARLEPALKKDHLIQFFLDGAPVAKPTQNSRITLENSAYGPHTAYYQILDSNGKVVQKSQSIKFTLLHVVRKKKTN